MRGNGVKVPGSKVSRASWLRSSESERVIDDDDVLRLPPAIGRGGAGGEVRGVRCDGGMIGGRWGGTGEGKGEGAGDPALGVRLPGVEG